MEIRLFGAMEVRVNGDPLPKTRERKDLWLLALLVLHSPHAVSREKLASDLWPDSLDSRRRLDRSLSELRKALGEMRGCIVSDTTQQSLRIDLKEISVDLIAFNQALQQKDPAGCEQAIELYRGRFLEGCFGDWAQTVRNEYEEKYLHLLRYMGARAETSGDFECAAALWRKVYEADPYAELEHELQKLLLCLGSSKRLEEAKSAYKKHRIKLWSKCRREPRTETTSLFNSLSRLSDIPPSNTDVVFRPPCPLSEIIGRETKLENLETLLRQTQTAGARLVTLTGTGGVGKTRLACELAYRLRHAFPNGSAFIELAALPREAGFEMVTAEVAKQLHVRERQGQELWSTVADFLHSMSLLLVLDNCEHVRLACAEFARKMLENCPDLRLLITSRHRLKLFAETIEPVEPLAYPIPVDLPTVSTGLAEQIAGSPAVRLFVRRANALDKEFTLTDENARDVAAICHRLDGLPLAIELAASRVTVLSIAEIREQLTKRFAILVGGEGIALPRQQAMEETIAWSYELLSPVVQDLFAKLSVFAGGWTKRAAEQVCMAHVVERENIPLLLSELLDHSLIQRERLPDGEYRYRFLETIREYAGRQLDASRRREAIEERHRHWCLRFIEEADSYLRGPHVLLWLRRIDQEYDNLRIALDWACSEEGSGEYGLKLTCLMAHFWWVHSHVQEGCRRFETLILKAPTSPEWMARAKIRGGSLAEYSGRTELAVEWLECGLEWMRKTREMWEVAYALNALGFAYHTSHTHNAEKMLIEGLEIASELNDKWLIAALCSTLGFVRMFQQESESVHALLDQGLQNARSIADPWLINELNYHLGLNAVGKRDFQTARHHLEECLPTFEEFGDRLALCSTHAHLGTIYLLTGNESSACRHWQRSFQLGKAIGYHRGIALSLDGFALFAEKRNKPQVAVRLIRAADAIRDRWQTPRVPFWSLELDTCLAQSLHTLGEKTYHSTSDEGYRLSIEQAETIITTITV